jgi:hypothetical protein
MPITPYPKGCPVCVSRFGSCNSFIDETLVQNGDLIFSVPFRARAIRKNHFIIAFLIKINDKKIRTAKWIPYL